MPNFSKKTNSRGKVMYFMDGKLVAKASIPEDVAVVDRDFDIPAPIEHPRSALDAVNDGLNEDVFIEGFTPLQDRILPADTAPQAPIQHPNPERPAPEARLCLFCGEPGEATRFVNLQVIDLCRDHYETTTLGEVAQVMREKQTA